ncbi:hypothetical protein ACFWDI_31195 [Streptomyces sp. NPDC060064]|uniref:methylation-associated defense system ATP-binding protein MAD8 n=1 Tax=Streptomyces sp. NPDC060064 TaxID=3347049 RepID=UPI0036CBD33F
MSSGTTGMTEPTAKDLRDAIESVLAPRLAALVATRSTGHCMRITEVEAELAAALVRRLRGAVGPDATVCLLLPEAELAPDRPFHDVGVSSTKLVELRNRTEGEGILPGPLLAFVPPGTKVSAEDSFGIATFEEVPLGDAYAHLAEHLLDQVPERLRPGIDALLATLRSLPGARGGDRAVAHYLLTLRANDYREQVAGAAAYHFGLVPDFDLFTDLELVSERVGKNHRLVEKLTASPHSERQRVLELGLSDSDFASRLAGFASRCGLEDPQVWTRRIVVDRENWSLSFGNWRIDEKKRAAVSIEVRELGLPIVGDSAESAHVHPALSAIVGQPYLLAGEKGVRDLAVPFAVQPEPRKVEGLTRFRVEIVSESGGPIGRIGHIGKGTRPKAEYKATLVRLNKVDWEEGWHYVRVVPLDKDDEPLDVLPGAHDLPGGESEHFYVVPGGEIEEPPERSVGRFSGVAQALRSLQLDAMAAAEDPEQVTPLDARWRPVTARSPQKILNVRIQTVGSAEVRLSPLLVQAQQDLLARPGDTSLRRILLHPDGSAEMSTDTDQDLEDVLTGRAAEAYRDFLAARRAYFAAIGGQTDRTSQDGVATSDGLLVSEAVDFEGVRDELGSVAKVDLDR